MTGRMTVCNIVDALSRTESLYHGLRLSLIAGGNRLPRLVFQFPAILCRSSSGEILHGFEFPQLWQFDAEHWSNILRVLRPEGLPGVEIRLPTTVTDWHHGRRPWHPPTAT